MATRHITPGLKITLRDVTDWCQEYWRFHKEWPRFDSTDEEFARAGVHGMCGRDIAQVLRTGSNGIEQDPAYQRKLDMAFRHGHNGLDLAFIDPETRHHIPDDALERILGSIGAVPAGGVRPANSLWLSFSFGLEMRGISAYVPLTEDVLAYIGDCGLIYGNEPRTSADSYYMELIDNGRLFFKYSRILGSRYAAELAPEQIEALRARLYAMSQPAEHVKTAATPARTLGQEMASLIVDGSRLILPKEQLAHYADIKSRVEKAGGRYVTGRKEFVFDEGIDVAEVHQHLKGGAVINFQQQFQFFATPPEQGAAMIRELERSLGTLKGKRILEPSAGDGALADLARAAGAEVVTIEAWNVNAIKLRKKGYGVIEKDFLQVTPDEIGTFDAVLANPPFTKDQDIAHVMHMIQFVRPGGAMSVITSTGWQESSQRKHVQFREYLVANDVEFHPIAAGAFKESGTTVPTVRLEFRIPHAPIHSEVEPSGDELADAPSM